MSVYVSLSCDIHYSPLFVFLYFTFIVISQLYTYVCYVSLNINQSISQSINKWQSIRSHNYINKLHVQMSRNFLFVLPVAVARSSDDDSDMC